MQHEMQHEITCNKHRKVLPANGWSLQANASNASRNPPSNFREGIHFAEFSASHHRSEGSCNLNSL